MESVLNDIAVLVLLAGEEVDSDLRLQLVPLFDAVGRASTQNVTHKPLGDAAKALLAELNSSNKVSSAKINKFVSDAQHFLRDPARAHFSTQPSETEVAEGIDQDLLVEFIEKHSTLMEELEAHIVNLRYQAEDPELSEAALSKSGEEFDRYLKAYVHNIKGDAGSLGLRGIAHACHEVEDALEGRPGQHLLEALLIFREWVGKCMREIAGGRNPSETSESFLERFTASVAAAKSAQFATDSSEAPTGNTSAVPEGANLDLIAELLADGIGAEKPAAVTSAETVPESASAKGASQEGESYSLGGDPEVFIEFATEAEDHLNGVEESVLESRGVYSSDSIAAIFRAVHSIKGASSYFTLAEVTENSHILENLLDDVRNGKRSLDEGLSEVILTYISLVREVLRRARPALVEGRALRWSEASSNFLARLKRIQAGESAASKPGSSLPAAPDGTAGARSDEAASAKSSPEKSGEEGEKLDVKQFVKVDTQRLDQLVDSIGEMCIYSSMLIQHCRALLGDHQGVLKTSSQVEKFSRDLQEIGMSMRLVPIRGLFQKMSRLVWDVSRKLGKEVKFHMDGEDTELDRTVIDKLADPLMHMVRNALDHGLESPDERVAAGKPKSGNVWLAASYAGGNIQIRIRDDGRGLNPEKLMKKAVEKGIISEHAKMDRREIYNLIFAAGFSTAAVVTDISGRGVGMDVVKRNIESIRGRVQIDSELGKGAVFTIELPLTLAVIDGFDVKVGQERFIVPTLSIVEFQRPVPDQIIRTLDRGETYQFRGRYLAVFRLARLFQVEGSRQSLEECIFLIVETGGEQVALVVDEICGTCSTVIKSLGEMFESGKGVTGGAIMATGDVALILDVPSLIQLARRGETVSLRPTLPGERGSTVEFQTTAS